MAYTKEQICSRALNTIGSDGINDFLDETNRAGYCADIWPTYSQYLLSIYDWYFARKKAQLGRLLPAPVNEYKYQFELPGDYLAIRAIYDSGDVRAFPILDYDLFGNRVYANADALWADYRAYLIPQAWPIWFSEFAINAFAIKLSQRIPTDAGKLERLKTETWGLPSDNMRGGMYGFVMNLDSKMRPAEDFQEAELIAARYF
jgi:hypothetical protein